MRYVLLIVVLLLGACDQGPRSGKLAIIDSPEAGLSLRELPAPTLRSLGHAAGAHHRQAEGQAERAGLKIGDVLYGINQKKADSLEEFNKLLSQQDSGSLGFLVRRGGSDFYVAVDLAGATVPGEIPKNPPARDTLLRT